HGAALRHEPLPRLLGRGAELGGEGLDLVARGVVGERSDALRLRLGRQGFGQVIGLRRGRRLRGLGRGRIRGLLPLVAGGGLLGTRSRLVFLGRVGRLARGLGGRRRGRGGRRGGGRGRTG